MLIALVWSLVWTSSRKSIVLSSQKVLSGSGRAGRHRLMGKYIDHCLVARPEPVNTFWDDSTVHINFVVTPTQVATDGADWTVVRLKFGKEQRLLLMEKNFWHGGDFNALDTYVFCWCCRIFRVAVTLTHGSVAPLLRSVFADCGCWLRTF